MTVPTRTDQALLMVELERDRQRRLLEEGSIKVDLSSVTVGEEEKLPVLLEEVGEVARAMNEDEGYDRLISELIEVAAVACAWAESLMDLNAYVNGS